MGTFFSNLSTRFHASSLLMRLVYLNVATFVVVGLLRLLLPLFGSNASGIVELLSLPSSWGRLLHSPWSLITYMFVHTDLLHLLFNMLWLYWFGGLFQRYFAAKQVVGLYLFGGIIGGILYLLAYTLLPFFEGKEAMLLGASASVIAIVAATVVTDPSYKVRLFLVGEVPIYLIALITIGIDLVSVAGENSGGHIAHFGGALAGVLFVVLHRQGIDSTAPFTRLITLLANLRPRQPKMRVTSNHKRSQEYEYNSTRNQDVAAIDNLLEKIKRSGYGSLTADEKRQLFDKSNRV